MTTKTYRAPTMMDALQIVQKELGSDAIVLSMRQLDGKSGWQFWQKGGCEVIAMPRLTALQPAAPSSPATPSPTHGPSTGEPKAAQTEPMKHSAAAMSPIVPPAIRYIPAVQARQKYQDKIFIEPKLDPDEDELQLVKQDIPGALLRLNDLLKAQGVDAALIGQIMSTCVRVVTPLGMQDNTSVDNLARRVMEAQVKAIPRPTIFPPTRVMCLVGPSGSGKTSTCAKLAYTYAKKLAKKVVWISADTIRTGAISETRTYTEGLGIQLELAYLPEELEHAVTSYPDADLILIDTPRCNPYREDSLVEIAPFLTRVPGRSIYLVLPATMKDTDLRQASANLRTFTPRGTIITKLDETCSLGSVYNLACQSPAPLTYLTSGTQLSAGLQSATAEILVEAVLNGKFEA
jgi:flagellar biosynthesis protein FlhF